MYRVCDGPRPSKMVPPSKFYCKLTYPSDKCSADLPSSYALVQQSSCLQNLQSVELATSCQSYSTNPLVAMQMASLLFHFCALTLHTAVSSSKKCTLCRSDNSYRHHLQNSRIYQHMFHQHWAAIRKEK